MENDTQTNNQKTHSYDEQFTYIVSSTFSEHTTQAQQFQIDLIDYLAKHNQIINSKSSNTNSFSFSISSLQSLGYVLQFIMVNRHPTIKVYIKLAANQKKPPQFSQIIQFGTENYPLPNNPSVQGYPFKAVDPAKVIRVFHIHGHFDKTNKEQALNLHEKLKYHLKEELKEKLQHHKVWFEKNGPHDKWSWEIHAYSPRAIAGLAVFVAQNGPIPGMSFPFHCRTYDWDEKNEYNDHVFRLGWIGTPDTDPLDINFFKWWK